MHSYLQLAAALWLSAAAAAETRILENFTLIDGTGRKPIPDAALLVVDGRIRYAGPKSKMKAPDGAERIDLSGKFVMPGIINLHGHLGNVAGLVQDPKNYTRHNLEKQLRLYAAYGVTSVLSMGSDQEIAFQVRAEQRAGRPAMTRLFTAGRGFTGKAGYPTSAPGMKGVPFEVDSAAEVEKAVAWLADKKADMVKIWVDDHLGREKKISMELCRAIIDNAHKRGLKVSAHIFYLEDARKLVEMGLDALVHSVRDKPADPALIDLMKQRKAWQGAATLTRELSTFVYAKPHPFLDDPFFTRTAEPPVLATLKSAAYQRKMAADPDLSKYPAFLKTAQRNLKALSEGGVAVGFGTDSGPPARFQGFFEHWEMELMVEAGLTPRQVIVAATQSAANFLGVSKDLGALTAGRWADLIVLARDPLANIRNTQSIESVWIAGNKVN